MTGLQHYSECMISTEAADVAVAPRPSLRERKKVATRRAIRRIALDLIAERGFSHVTVEDIAEAADISPRTFFNYFPSKEAVLFGADRDRTEALRERILTQPAEIGALEVLCSALVAEAAAVAEELAALGGEPATWLARMKAASVDPQLRAAQAAHMASVEQVIADALATRLGTEIGSDPYPQLLAGAAMGVMRAVGMIWAGAGGALSFEQLTDAAFQSLAAGLPEQCELRSIVETARLSQQVPTPNSRKATNRPAPIEGGTARPIHRARPAAGRKR